MKWKTIRVYLLAVELIAVFCVLGKIIIFPATEKKIIYDFTFPSLVPLTGWQQISSTPLTDKLVPDSVYFSGQNILGETYKYRQQDIVLEIQIRYLVDTNGDLKYFIKKYTSQVLPILYKTEGLGFYSFYRDKHNAYLTACINPYGETTVTSDQFYQNNLRHAFQLQRIAIWLTHQTKILDKRCLWTHIKIPLENKTPESLYPILKTAWFDWYRWWSQHYPQELKI
jgi:cyanosortase A-associated protein